MAIMNKMRDNMPAILIGLVLAFLVTIVFEWGMNYLGIKGGGRRDYVGIIDGKKISYQEFSDLVKRASDSQKQQTGQDPDDDMLRQIRDQVWNSLVTQVVVENAAKNSGITVSGQEIVDWVRGDNPPAFLVQQFKDSTGRFNREAYESAIADPRNKEIWIQVEQALRQQRLVDKVQSLIMASVRATPGEIRERFIDQNTKVNVQYALFDPNRCVADSAATVSDDDLRKFYNEHQFEFKMKATRKLKYVLFSDQPSARDSQDVLSELNSVLQQIKTGADFTELQKEYSESKASDAYFKHGQLSQTKEEKIFSAKVGDVVGPYGDYDGFHLTKILDERHGNETFVKARHILLTTPPAGSSAGNNEEAVMKKARALIARAHKGEDFTELAKKYSQEPGAASTGGELGWFGKGRMVKPFEDAAMKGKPGEIVGPVKTQYGIHIIKIEGKDNREVKLADIVISVKASSQTKDDAFQRAQDFAYVAKDGKFEKDAQSLGLSVRETPAFQKEGMIPGIGFNNAAMDFAFSKDLNDVSDAMPVNNGYAVFTISEVRNEGVRPFGEVKELLKPRAQREKKMEILKAIVAKDRATLGDTADLSALQTSDPNVSVQTTGEFAPNGGIPTVGREPAFVGIALTDPVQKISGPVKGVRGYYLLKVLSRTPFDSTSFNMQRGVLETQILQGKKQRVVNEWLASLKDKATIEDNRDQFYR
ncbi:MAG: peptidylprolyl isomerase [Bacteroidota bacterium]|nr:peptidylprolyl isomerase [Bacteroidota bacterium]